MDFLTSIHFLTALCMLWSLSVPVRGALYIDCGATASYVDPITGVTWVPDSGFISTGQNFANVPTAKTVWQDFPELNTLRFFNDSRAKNCYTLPVTINVTYLLTASFLWASYDNAASPPSFGLAIDGTILASVTSDATGATFDQLEFSIQPQNNTVYVCLTQLPLQSGTPFISAIYLRPGPAYALIEHISSRQMIRVRHRLNFGGTTTGRLPIDPYNRLWSAEGLSTTYLSATSPLVLLDATQTVVNNLSDITIPTVMLQTALTTSGNMTIQGMFGTPDPFISSPLTNWIFAYIVFYFAELDSNATATSREFYIQLPYLSDQYINPLNDTNTSQPFVASRSIQYTDFPSWWPIPLYRGQNSTLGPSLNALEFLEVTWTSNLKTIDRDAYAIDAIKSHLNLNEWTGDPCVPVPHAWVACTPLDVNNPPQITVVNLSGYNLIGTIPPDFADLWSIKDLLLNNNALSGSLPNLSGLANLKRLYLQDNVLSGALPDWLGTTVGLEELFIENNQFSGVIPATIRSKNLINFRYYPGNPLLQYTALPPIGGPPPKKWRVPLFFTLAILLGFVLLTGSITIFERYRWHAFLREEYTIAPGAKLYSYEVIQKATNNFKTKIGEGGSAQVYRGKLDGQDVAVKCLNLKSPQRSNKEFKNEVKILSEIRHKNLVSLVGYCDDETRLILVYEYMHNKSLQHQLVDNSVKLDWEARLNIAIGVAQGLKYLHFYCFPKLIHCDIKSANILLAKEFDLAKVSDFGITKLGADNTRTLSPNTQTKPYGTEGYEDPVCRQLPNQVSTSMDVYSFGVVLYVLLVGLGAVSMVSNKEDISAENLDATVRSTKKNDSSVNKVMEIAASCVLLDRKERPKINVVLEKLIEAKNLEDGTDQVPASTSTEEIA